jgi:antibiotic biosynthesis monooxygenase (ABM) superfamily enzyme
VEVNRNMGIVFVLTGGIKDGKRTEFQALMKKFQKIMKADPKVFEGLISFRLFEQEYGGVAGTYVEMCEFKSMEDMKKWEKRIFEHKEIKELVTELHKIEDHHTPTTQSIWNTVV